MTDDPADWTAGTKPLKGQKAYASRTKAQDVRLEIRPRPPAETGPKTQPQQGDQEIDARTLRRLTQGNIRVEARLDLHGLTHDAAQEEFKTFILNSRAAGHRHVLVITGKGGGAGRGPGVLRESLPHWTTDPALAPFILRVAPARPEDGGTGAYSIYLRRKR